MCHPIHPGNRTHILPHSVKLWSARSQRSPTKNPWIIYGLFFLKLLNPRTRWHPRIRWFYQPAPESTTTRCESLGGDSRNGRNRWTRYQSRKNRTDRQRDKNVMWIRVGRMASVLSFGAWYFVEMKLGRHFRAAPTHLGTVLRALRARGAAYQTDAAATFTVKSAAP
jgi:hypothetical protein